jgi:aspartate racemase
MQHFFCEKIMMSIQIKGPAQASSSDRIRPAPLFGRVASAASHRRRHVVGILGGMGPVATADFYLKLVQATPASSDQEHLRVLIWADPTIPDRTEALLLQGADPTPALIAGARLLEASGAGMLAVPCNTAHAFLGEVQAKVSIPIVHMIEETANHIQALVPAVRQVGLLSTTGTQKAGLYQAWLERKGISVLSPEDDVQDQQVMASIRGIKAGWSAQSVRLPLIAAAESLISAGAQVIIGGCTEIPLGLAPDDIELPLVDPAQILADAVVRRVLASA